MFYPIFCSQGLNAITSWLPAQSSHIFNGYSDFHIFSMVSLSLHMFDGYTTFSHVLCCYTQCFPYFWWLYTMFPIFLMVWLFRIFIILCFVIPHFSNMPDGYTPCLQYFWCIYIYVCISIFPYVWWLCHMFSHIFGLYHIIRHFWSQSFSYVWVIPIFLMVLRCSSLYFRWLYPYGPYVWWLYHMVVPHGRKPSKSSASAAASARSQVGWKIQVVECCWWGKKHIGTHGKNLENIWKTNEKDGKHWEDPRSKWRWSEHHLWFRYFPSPHLIGGAMNMGASRKQTAITIKL